MGFLRKILSKPARVPEPVGWQAIDRAVDALYPGQEPRHWGTVIRYRMGGPDPLDGVSAFTAADPTHWHYVSYGLSELYGKESADWSVSGWGIELTFRLLRRHEPESPLWPVNLMQNLARYVYETGNVLLPGHHLNLNGPIAVGDSTEVTGALFLVDKQLGTIATPNGEVTFVQIVGVTADELEAAQQWDTNHLAAILERGDPRLITDLDRPSIRTDPAFDREIAAGIERDGSSMGGVNLDSLHVSSDGPRLTVRIGALAVDRLDRLFRGRTRHGRGFWMRSPESTLGVEPGETLAWSQDAEGHWMLVLPASVIDELVGRVPAQAGQYEFGDGRLIVAVEQTVIRDPMGNEVERVG